MKTLFQGNILNGIIGVKNKSWSLLKYYKP